MDKKTLAYILIGGAVIAGAYLLYKKLFGAPDMGADAPDTRGAWAADDDATWTNMRSTFSAESGDPLALSAWVDDAVKTRYDAGGSSIHKIQGQKSKAGTFLSVFEEVNPNVKGKHVDSSGKKLLWPPALHAKLWDMFYALKNRYPAM